MKKQYKYGIIIVAVLLFFYLIKKHKKMKIDYKGDDFIKEFEGFSSSPYLDSAGVATIGYGFTFYPNGAKVTMDDMPLSKRQADDIFKKIVAVFEKGVSEAVTSKLTQNRFNALVSFAYNVGLPKFRSSTLLKKVNAMPGDASIKDEFLKWNKAGGVVIDGLTARRQKEADLYFKKSFVL